MVKIEKNRKVDIKASSLQTKNPFKMMFIGALLSLCAAASAIPLSSSLSDLPSSSLQLSGDQLRSLLGALNSHGSAISQDIDQNISCTVSYTLTLGNYYDSSIFIDAKWRFRRHCSPIHHRSGYLRPLKLHIHWRLNERLMNMGPK